MPGKVLVAVDFSDVGRGAFDVAVALAKDLDAPLVLVHAFQRSFMAADLTPGTGLAVAAAVPDLEAQVEHATHDRLEADWAAEARQAGLAVTAEAVDGDPATAIVEAAKRHHASLIVVGTHGRTGVQRLVLGSTAEVVVRHADRPVLVVPHKARDDGPWPPA